MTITELLRKPWRQKRANLPVRNNQNTRRPRFTPQVEQLEERVNPHHIRLDAIPIVVESPAGTMLHVTGSATQINGTASWDLIAIESGTGTGFAKANVDFTPIVQHFSITVNNSNTVTPFSADIPIPYNPINTGNQQFYVKLVNNVGTLIDNPNPRTAIIVDGTPPPVTGPAQGNINEGSTYTGSASFSDVSNYGPWTVVVNYGDGTAPVNSQKTSPGSISLSHLYPQDSSSQSGGVYHGTITVTDKYGVSGSTTFGVLVNNVAPQFSLLPNETILVGQSVGRLNVPFTDPGADVGFWLAPGPAQVIRVSDGQVVGTTAVSTNQDGKKLTLAPFTFNQPGVYEVRVGLCDDDTVTYRSFQVTVVNNAPIVTGANRTLNEGNSYSAEAHFTDTTGTGPWTITVDFGDGTSPVTFQRPSPGGIPLNHLYSQDSSNQPGGVYHGTITVTDQFGASACANFEALVHNVAPKFSLLPNETILVGQSVGRLNVPFGDPGADSGFWLPIGPAQVIRVSDGQVVGTTSVSTDQDGKTLTLAPFTFTQPGVYEICVGLRDDDTVTYRSFQVTVVNNAPIVTGADKRTLNEGSSYSASAHFSDTTGTGPWTITVDFGDGTTPVTFQQSSPGAIPLNHLFSQDSSNQPGGIFRGSITVTDEFGASACAHFEALVLNVAPKFSLLPNETILVGQSVGRVNVPFGDPGADSGFWLPIGPAQVIRLSDGQVIGTTSVSVDQDGKTLTLAPFTFTQPGVYEICVGLRDDDTVTYRSFQVTVVNNPPEVVAPASGPIFEGSSFTAFGSFSDSTWHGPWTVSIDYGDGSAPVTFSASTPGAIPLSHLYVQDSSDQPGGVYHGSITITDEFGATGSADFTVTVLNVSPVVDAGADLTIGAGQSQSIIHSGSFTDPGSDAPWSGSWTVSLNGITVSSGVLSVDNNGKTFTLTTPPLSQPGDYVVSITVDDDDGSGSGSYVIHVVNAPPIVSPPTRDAIEEGTFWRSFATFTDATGHGPWTIVIDYGTGGTPLIAQLSSPGAIPLTHFFAQDSSDQPGGVYHGTVTVIDEFGATGTAHFEVLVRNVAPSPRVGDNVVLNLRQPLKRAATFTDPGADAPWTIRINYGDGKVEQFTTNSKDFTFSHQYAYPGTYQVVVTISDDDTSSRAAFNVTVRSFVLPPWFFNPPEKLQFLPAAPLVMPQQRWLPSDQVWRLQEQDYWRTNYGGGMELNQPPEVYFELVCEEDRTRLLDEGDTLIQDGFFYDPNPGDSHIGFVDFGDNTGWHALPLRVDKTFKLSHKYDKPGEYEVYVKVIDNKGAVGYKSLRVIVENIAPSVSFSGDRRLTEGQEFSASGEFKDPGLNCWTATVDYGDGSPVEPLKLDGKSFKLRHKYARKGTYTVRVVVNDGTQDGAAELKIEVAADKVRLHPGFLTDDQWKDIGAVMASSYGCELEPESGDGSLLGYSVAALALGLLIPVALKEEKSWTSRRRSLDRVALDEYFALFHR